MIYYFVIAQQKKQLDHVTHLENQPTNLSQGPGAEDPPPPGPNPPLLWTSPLATFKGRQNQIPQLYHSPLTNRPFYILNLLHLRSIMGCPGGTPSVFTHTFWAKRELHCIFRGKKAIIVTSKHGTIIFFFSDYNLFLGKVK